MRTDTLISSAAEAEAEAAPIATAIASVPQCPKCRVWGQECAYGAPCESSYAMSDQSGARAYQNAYNTWLGTENGQAWESRAKAKRRRYDGFLAGLGRSGGEL